MSTAQVVKVPSGGTLAIREGVLRGAGPQGPIGPPGAQGLPGPAGATGPAGSIDALLSVVDSTSAVATSYDHWYPMTVDTPGHNDLLNHPTVWDGLNLQFKSAMTVLMVAIARWETTHAPSSGGTASGARALRFADASGTVLNNATIEVEGAHNEPTWVLLVQVITPDPSKFYHLEGKSHDDTGTLCTERHVTFVQVGAGPDGPPGPPGSVGATGPQGPQGIPGSAGSGYASLNAVAPGTPDTTQAPSGVTYIATPDQQLRTPAGTDLPYIPYFISLLAKDIEPRLNARYTGTADRNTRRPSRSAGEVTYLNDSGSLQFREKVGGADNNIARVIVSAAAPPSGAAQAAPGVIWIQQ